MVFSTNQTRQFYVAKAIAANLENATAGSIKVGGNSSEFYFSYMGAGGQTRSDLIPTSNIVSAKATNATDLARPLVRTKVVLDSTINGGTPVAGQDYVLRVSFRNYIGMSEEDQYFKYGVVHAYSGMNASSFYKTMALSLAKNFTKLEGGLLKFYVETGGTSPTTVGTLTEVTSATDPDTLTGTYSGIVVEEKEQEWILGRFQQVPVNYTLQPTTIISNGDERIWGVSNKVASVNSIKDGKKIADLEYFCMGERGDIYRNIGFPNVINTTYLVDPTIEYNLIDIAYFFQDGGEGVQKSEKVITVAVPKIGGTEALGNTLTNELIDDINALANLSIAKL